MDIKKLLGQKIKRLRLKHNLTQEQLAEKMQLAPRTLCGIENGENFVKAETVNKFCEVFKISSFELFAFDHIKPQEDLINEMVEDIKTIKNREKIETLFKIIKALKVE